MAIGLGYEGVNISMDGNPDSDGDIFVISDIEGLDGMDTEIELIDNHRDGSAFTKGRYPKRELNVKGIGYTRRSVANGSLRIRNKIEAWFADYLWKERWLYVNLPSPGIAVQLKTRPGGKIHFDPPEGTSQKFEIPFTCADPRKYAMLPSNGEIADVLAGTTTLYNYGNFPTFIVATLQDTTTDPYIQNNTTGNQRITLQGSVAAGTTVDFLARRTLAGGTTLQEMAQRPRIWWYLQPGANVISSNCHWRAQYRSAYR